MFKNVLKNTTPKFPLSKSLSQPLRFHALNQTALYSNQRSFFNKSFSPNEEETQKIMDTTQTFMDKISQHPNVVEKFSAAQQVFVKKNLASKSFETMSAWESVKFLLDPEIKKSITDICDEMKKSNLQFNKEDVHALFAAINTSMKDK